MRTIDDLVAVLLDGDGGGDGRRGDERRRATRGDGGTRLSEEREGG
jgi:hypothetical protein